MQHNSSLFFLHFISAIIINFPGIMIAYKIYIQFMGAFCESIYFNFISISIIF